MEKRSQKYVTAKRNNPIKNASDVKTSKDKHIDQDFSGFPDSPAKENVINPKTKQEKKTAAVNVQDGEKTDKYKEAQDEVDEQQSDGSGGAFSESDFLLDDEA
jgi:hypothetical protein